MVGLGEGVRAQAGGGEAGRGGRLGGAGPGGVVPGAHVATLRFQELGQSLATMLS